MHDEYIQYRYVANSYKIYNRKLCCKKFAELCQSNSPSKLYPMYTQERACDLLCKNQILNSLQPKHAE